MRSLVIASALAFATVSVSSAHAMGPKPKVHKGKKKGKKNKGKKNKVVISGAGQRLHFSFGGRLVFNQTDNLLEGKFSIIVHPLSPPGDIINTVCRYNEMSNAELDGNNFQFDATGKCRSLRLDGSSTVQVVTSHVTIQDNGTGDDGIDVDVVGGSGIAVPGGALSHGNFTIAGP